MLKTIIIISAFLLFLVFFLGLFLIWAAGSRYFREEIKGGFIKDYPEFSIQDRQTDRILRVMTYNIGYASGLKNNMGSVLSREEVVENLERIVHTIQGFRPHIVALQEVDFSSRRSHYINEMDYIARRCKFAHASYAITWDKRYVPFPFTLSVRKHFGAMVSGQVVLSAYPIIGGRPYYFEKPVSNPYLYNLFYLDRIAQHVRVEVPRKGIIDVYNIHLEAFDKETRQDQARKLVAILKENGFSDGFILGDFNALPPDAEVTHGFPDEPYTDMKDDDTINTILASKYVQEIPFKPNSFSFPSKAPNCRLDYIFSSSGFIIKEVKVMDDAGSGSDHLPVSAVFGY